MKTQEKTLFVDLELENQSRPFVEDLGFIEILSKGELLGNKIKT
jgi:hypothetical protein